MGVTAYTPFLATNDDFATVRSVEQPLADAPHVRTGEPGAREIRLGAAVALPQVRERREHRLGARVIPTLDPCARLLVRGDRERRLEFGREGRDRQRVVRGDLRVVDADDRKSVV